MSCNRWATVAVDGTVTIRTDRGEYEKYRGFIGGWLEGVPTTGQVTIYCDEEGKIKGLPVNPVATAFVAPFLADIIVGPVLFMGPPDEEGEETDIPWDVELMLKRTAKVFTVLEGCSDDNHSDYRGQQDAPESSWTDIPCPSCRQVYKGVPEDERAPVEDEE